MSYPSDMTDAQWAIIEPLTLPFSRSRPREHNIRLILNAIFYILRSGCQWRMLPKDFPPWKTVYDYYWRWRKNGKWDEIHAALRDMIRVSSGKDVIPSAAIIDSRSVRTVQKGGKEDTMLARKSRVASSI